MKRSIWLVLLMGAVLLAPMTVGVSQADAFWGCGWGWGWNCGSCYCSPCCTVSCDPCCASPCGWHVGYRPAPIRRLLFGPCATAYACYPTCATTAVSYATVEDAGYSTGAAKPVTMESPTPAPEAPPVEPPPVEPLDIPEPPTDVPGPPPFEPPIDLLGPGPSAPAPSPGGVDFDPLGTEPSDGGAIPLDRPGDEPAMPGFEPSDGAIPNFNPSNPSPPAGPLGKTHTRADSGLLTIYVPYDAEVKVNGLLTQSQGSRREYVSYGLKSGFSYKYEIEATIVREGQKLTDTRTVILTAGDIEAVAFGFNPAPASNVASAW